MVVFRVNPTVNKESADTESFDDSNADENRPNDVEANAFYVNSPYFKQRKEHQNYEVPKVYVFAHN
jgi:hypothetical protein